jgi:hypothetical protein
MKYQMSAAVAALISNSNAVQMEAKPSVWGPGGKDYDNTDARYDLSLIGIDVTTPSNSGKSCNPGDWVTAKWKASLNDGRVVADEGQKVFILGNSEVFKCWDLGVQKLHEGDKATL